MYDPYGSPQAAPGERPAPPPGPPPLAAAPLDSAGADLYAVPAGGILAGVGRRFLALVIDSLIMMLAGLILDMLFGLDATAVLKDQQITIDPILYVLGGLLNMTLAICYYGYFWGTSGQTPGKRALKIEVVRKDYQPMTLRTGVIRAAMIHGVGLVGTLATLPLTNTNLRAADEQTLVVTSILVLLMGLYQLLDYCWALWDHQRQTIHDKVAGTLVIHRRSL